MKKCCIFILCIMICSIYLFSGCDQGGGPKEEKDMNETTDINQTQEMEEQNDEDKSKEITIKMFGHGDTAFDYGAKLFEQQTGIKVNIEKIKIEYERYDVEVSDGVGGTRIETIVEDPYPTNAEKYIKKAVTELSSGTGADIYEIGHLDYENLGKQNLLCNLNEWIEEDPNLSEDKIFSNILRSQRTEQGLFAIPISFTGTGIAAKTDHEPALPEKQMTWSEFFNTASSLPINGMVVGETELNLFMTRFAQQAERLISRENKALDEEKVIKLLKECASWRDQGLCADSRNPETLIGMSSYYSDYRFGSTNAVESICKVPEGYSNMINPIIAPSPSDVEPPSAANIAYNALYGINEGSSKKELAWQFLAFMLSPEMQQVIAADPLEGGDGYFPINRETMREAAERGADAILEAVPEAGMDKEKCVEKVMIWADEIENVIISKPYYREMIREPAKEYFLDKITAEEAAQRMADKVGLYLKEQG